MRAESRKENVYMTMSIAYLEAGPLLDYWVAMAAGYDPAYQADSDEGERVLISKCHHQGELVSVPPRAFRPSTSWADAGPIIERERIELLSDFGRWMARHERREDYSRADASPLVTAMRAYLAWEYGDEVPTG
jgi:hypothetical protein